MVAATEPERVHEIASSPHWRGWEIVKVAIPARASEGRKATREKAERRSIVGGEGA